MCHILLSTRRRQLRSSQLVLLLRALRVQHSYFCNCLTQYVAVRARPCNTCSTAAWLCIPKLLLKHRCLHQLLVRYKAAVRSIDSAAHNEVLSTKCSSGATPPMVALSLPDLCRNALSPKRQVWFSQSMLCGLCAAGHLCTCTLSAHHTIDSCAHTRAQNSLEECIPAKPDASAD